MMTSHSASLTEFGLSEFNISRDSKDREYMLDLTSTGLSSDASVGGSVWAEAMMSVILGILLTSGVIMVGSCIYVIPVNVGCY